MSDFATAVTAVEMAVKAFGLEGQISVQMDSEAETIVLNEVAKIWFDRSTNSVVAHSIDDEGRTDHLVGSDDVVEAVVEAVVHVIAEQARDVLHTIFEAVEDEVGFD